MSAPIVVINPNSTEAVTSGIDAAMAPLRVADGPGIECITLKEGPPGIESQVHADSVVQPICRAIAARDNDAAAFIIACFSDPGLHAARETTRKPVLGIAECGVLTALTLGQRFGVIAILKRSLPRQQRYIGAMGLQSRYVGSMPVDLGVVELADEGRTVSRMIEVGIQLKDRQGADVVIMGCAGMARYRDRLQQALGIPVVEPTQAAAAMAIGRVRLGWERAG